MIWVDNDMMPRGLQPKTSRFLARFVNHPSGDPLHGPHAMVGLGNLFLRSGIVSTFNPGDRGFQRLGQKVVFVRNPNDKNGKAQPCA